MKPLTQRALLATAVWAAVSAQTASAQLEEVLVTAERREANLQDTPISITTLSDQEIIDRGINSADDLITQVAGCMAILHRGQRARPALISVESAMAPRPTSHSIRRWPNTLTASIWARVKAPVST